MDERSRRDLALLNSIAQDQRLTQRRLSEKLGIALGLTNLYLKRFARKGYIKCVNIQANRILYYLTPKGVAEKTRLTYEFWEYSLQLYHEVRQHLRVTLRESLAAGAERIALYGTGEAAELAYLCLKEVGLEPVAVFHGESGGSFLGIPVRAIGSGDPGEYDLLIVATLEAPEGLVGELALSGVPEDRIVTLRRARE